MKISEAIKKYIPWNEQEERDKELMLRMIREPGVFTRENTLAHFTASAWVVNHARTKVLMCYHKIYDSWSWLGGHADGDEDLLHVAMKEIMEESGLTSVTPVSDKIYSLEALTVDGHVKKGKYVSSHIHMNVTYLLEADENAPLTIREDENSGLRWFTLQAAIDASTEPWFKENIYPKLNAKLVTVHK